ncbi:MAG: SH3 domain-containing protein [Pseudomonadota bacterium]
MRSLAAVLILIAHLTVMACPAQAAAGVRLDTPSGYPVPRFVSLKDDETNCRIGPSFDHPVRYIFKRAGAPVLVVAESVDHWRKIRDPDGDECWVHRTTLMAQTHVLVIADLQLSRHPSADAPSSARLGAGVLARLVRRKDGWLFVSAGNAKGWVASAWVWGGDPSSEPAGPD